jgi:hypothetical protein
VTSLLAPGLEGEATIVRTAVFAQVADRLAFTIAHRATMVVAGEHGTGKRVALLTCLAAQPVPYLVVPVPPAPSPKDMVRLLYGAVHQNRDVFALRDMQDELTDTLCGEPLVIVIDGAHRLTAQAAGQLHYLHARPGATWTLLLLGGPDTARIIATDANLRGDVLAAVAVEPLKGEDLLYAVRAMHQLFNMADEELLKIIDTKLCGGLLKNWARFLQIALDLRDRAIGAGRDTPVLDVDFARAVTMLMPQLRTTRKR